MPRTFLVRRVALQIDNLSSAESEDEHDKQSELHVNQNLGLSVGSEFTKATARAIQEPLIVKEEDAQTNERKSLELSHLEKSPRYLSRAVHSALQVDAVTGAIENKEQLLNLSLKEECPDLDAEVAYHTDKSFSSISDRQTVSRATTESFSPDGSFQSDITNHSIQEFERSSTTPLLLPVITPHQPLPPFASLAYNVFISTYKSMGETMQETGAIDSKPTGIIRLPLKVPENIRNDESVSNTNSSIENTESTKINQDVKTVDVKQEVVETKDSEKKSAPKIWNPFTHVATPKSNKVLPNTHTTSSPYIQSTSKSSQHVSAVSPINCSYVPLMRSISSLSSVEINSPRHGAEKGSCLTVDRSPYQTVPANTFQTVPQINSSLGFSPAFSPRAPSPFVPYRPFCTPDSYQPGPSSRTSTPVMTPLPTTPNPLFTDIALPLTGQKRPSTPSHETPKRRKLDTVPFQIYKESPSPRLFDPTVQKMGCPMTPVLVSSSCNQENLPVNRTPLSAVQQRMPLKPMSPAVMCGLSKENVPVQKESTLKPMTGNISQKIEVINGGYGIKNPSFVPPKPADITNIQHDESGKGSFVCKVCGKEFAMQRLLNRHLKCHSEAKRYLCTFCGKGFNDTFDLKRHTRIHTGVKPYKCDHCEKAFTQRCSLESHCRKVHNLELNYGYKQRRSKTYVCEDCGHSTTDPEVHYNHLKERHPNCPALAKPHDKRHFKFQEVSRPSSGPLRPRN